jgi:hypothetical protein
MLHVTLKQCDSREAGMHIIIALAQEKTLSG